MAAVILAACSSTQFFYNRLDTFIGWYVDDYVRFDNEQQARFDQELSEFFRWHRREELPVYIRFLADFETLLDREITEADTDRMANEFRAAVDRAQVRAVNAMLVMGATLDEAQIRDFLAELKKQQREYEQDRLDRSDEQYVEDAYDSLKDNLEDYLGRLNPMQKATLKQAAEQYIRLDRAWLKDRAEWNALLETVLTARAPGWQEVLRNAVASRRAGRGEAFETSLEHNASLTRTTIRQIVNQRSAKQDNRLRRRIRRLREDFEALVADGAP